MSRHPPPSPTASKNRSRPSKPAAIDDEQSLLQAKADPPISITRGKYPSGVLANELSDRFTPANEVKLRQLKSCYVNRVKQNEKAMRWFDMTEQTFAEDIASLGGSYHHYLTPQLEEMLKKLPPEVGRNITDYIRNRVLRDKVLRALAVHKHPEEFRKVIADLVRLLSAEEAVATQVSNKPKSLGVIQTLR